MGHFFGTPCTCNVISICKALNTCNIVSTCNIISICNVVSTCNVVTEKNRKNRKEQKRTEQKRNEQKHQKYPNQIKDFYMAVRILTIFHFQFGRRSWMSNSASVCSAPLLNNGRSFFLFGVFTKSCVWLSRSDSAKWCTRRRRRSGRAAWVE